MMENEKGKRPIIYGDEEDDGQFLQLLMTGHFDQPNGSSPAPISRPGDFNNSIGGARLLQGSSSSSGSSSKENTLIQERFELGGNHQDDFFFKFLNDDDTFSRFDQGNDVGSIIVPVPPPPPPPEVIVELPPAATRPAPRTRSARPRPTGIRKTMSPEKLAELALQDPKKAKRIMANRMSAVRSKEKKKLYTHMLEHKMKILNAESAALKAHLTLLQTESSSLSSENERLREETSTVLHQLQLQDSLNEEMKQEISQLRILTQMSMSPSNGMMFDNDDNNGNHGNNNKNDNNVAMGLDETEQLLQHNQVPYQYQVDQILQGMEEMNLGQQYPWQLYQVPDQQNQQVDYLFQQMMQQQQQEQHEEERVPPYLYPQQPEETAAFLHQEPFFDQDPENIANPPPNDQESGDD